jgi:hypothetical protein
MRILRAQGKILSPEVREMAPGRPMMRLGLQLMDQDGNITVHPCVAWGDMASKLSRYNEGDIVEVVARPSTNTRIGRKPMTEYIITEFTLLKPKP